MNISPTRLSHLPHKAHTKIGHADRTEIEVDIGLLLVPREEPESGRGGPPPTGGAVDEHIGHFALMDDTCCEMGLSHQWRLVNPWHEGVCINE